MDYISKNGQRELETDDGARIQGKGDLADLKQQWRFGGSEIAQKSHRREAYNVILSMPKGTEAVIVQAAARDMARREFAGHRYVMVLHSHQANPHVHVLVRAEGNHGQRLNPRKADLHRWREQFAAMLRTYGIEAAATRQAARGVLTNPRHVWQVHGEHGRTLNTVPPPEKSGHAVSASRLQAMGHWDGIAKTLAASDDLEDRKLAVAVDELLRDMPFRRELERGAGEVRPARGQERD